MATESKKTVLLVEDNEDNLVVYRTILEHVGYRVVEARDGEEGVTRARQDHPDLILMDMSLPVKDGWTATSEIKADAALRTIPVIALTAHAMAGDKDRALEAGCDDYDTKPVEFARLVSKIETLLGTAAGGAG